MKRRWWVAGVAGVVLVGLVGAGVVMAQTTTPSASGGSTSFLDRVAQKLGIETPKLQDAVKSAANDEIDAAVASGKLTQAQADKMKQGIANGKLPELDGPLSGEDGGFGHGIGRGFGPGAFGFGAGVDLSKLADFLSTPQDTLKTELQAANATLATVAQAHGKTRDELKTFLTDQAKTRLDQAITDQKLTQQQADDALAKMTANLDGVIDHSGIGRHGKGMRSMVPGAPAAPNSSATPGTGTRFGAPGRSSPITGAGSRA